MSRSAELRDNLTTVQRRIAGAARSVGRDPGEVDLVVITKYFPVDDVRRLIDLGVQHIGENKDQEASQKLADLPAAEREGVRVHFVGQLQSNKAGHVSAYADVVQSVDRAKIVNALAKGAARHERDVDVMLQVDLDGTDPGRGGVLADDLLDLAQSVADADRLTLRGVMAVAPRGGDAGDAFARLAELAGAVQAVHPGADCISAGMSGDLEAAIEHGATHVRVGSAILGPRPSL
ncbi:MULTISPECIES: YggS family pyridoxal phosphate-dependent enzyme [unclassified Yimella]|uniref:YggS family pyridoxal phosphate-dependent enzyme n=1 Tax=unclassified Yimella TaxID=2649892 RepID=UPI00101BD96C|nr:MULTISPECIES: YggS family pyridoxal phosphate-dependent enzyme [unclassified Yimella]MCG8655622.1 YggS family pyridoxal phosphate-dependent enzyme [Yimella sp. NH-Cas1]RYG78985.1 YggS family pyridoxal phosphate-dependent enzyme [Yimella sp. RIT 621]